MSVRSDHLLVQLLQSITVPMDHSASEYYDRVAPLADEIVQFFKFTNSHSYGEVHEGSDFYGQHYNEIVLAKEERPNILKVEKEWEQYAPVKVMKHDVVSFTPELLDGSDNSREGLSVIEIDLPLLALQYRMFRLREMKRPEGESQLTLGQFVMMYPVANMTMSHLDYASYNFMRAVMDGRTYEEFRNRNSFYTTNYDEKAMDVYERVYDIMIGRELEWQRFFKQIPAIFKDNQWEVLQLPSIVGTRQNEWAYSYARLDSVMDYFTTNSTHGLNLARSEARRVERMLRRIENDKAFRTLLPRELYSEFLGTVLALGTTL